VTRLSGDKKQVLVQQRNAEEERQHLQSTLTQNSHFLSTHVDDNEDIQLMSVNNSSSVDNEFDDVKPLCSDVNKPTVQPDTDALSQNSHFSSTHVDDNEDIQPVSSHLTVDKPTVQPDTGALSPLVICNSFILSLSPQ